MVYSLGSNSKFLQPESCCCGFPLRTGTLIIGWLTVVAGIFTLLFCINNGINPMTGVKATGVEIYTCEIKNYFKVCTLEFDSEEYKTSRYYNESTNYVRMYPLSDTPADRSRAGILMMLATAAALILIAGVNMNRADFLQPFMFVLMLIALYEILIVLLTVFTSVETELTRHEFTGFCLLALLAVVLFVDAYMLAVVNAYYNVLMKMGSELRPTAPPAEVVIESKY